MHRVSSGDPARVFGDRCRYSPAKQPSSVCARMRATQFRLEPRHAVVHSRRRSPSALSSSVGHALSHPVYRRSAMDVLIGATVTQRFGSRRDGAHHAIRCVSRGGLNRSNPCWRRPRASPTHRRRRRRAPTCVMRPTYWQLRDYGVPGQIGLEPTPSSVRRGARRGLSAGPAASLRR